MAGTEQCNTEKAKLIGFIEGVWHPEDMVRLEDAVGRR